MRFPQAIGHRGPRDVESGTVETPVAEPAETTPGKSRAKMLVQGAAVFVVMFTVLYLVLSRLTRDRSTGD